MARRCRNCGQQLLLDIPGRNLCERCLHAGVDPEAFADAFADAPGGVRGDDHETSIQGAIAVFGRSGNQRRKLFAAWLELPERRGTDYQAAVRSGLEAIPSCCWWKRAGELREAGVLAFTGETGPGGADVDRKVSVVTDLGYRVWSGL